MALHAVEGKLYPITSADQRFRLRISVAVDGPAGPVKLFLGVTYYDSAGNPVVGVDGTGDYPLGPGVVLDPAIHGWMDREVIIGKGWTAGSPHGGNANIPANAAGFRPVMYLNYDSAPGNRALVDYFTVQDVTAEVNAQGFATAAAGSASSASASQSAAGQQAAAADASRAAAETAKGGAEAARAAAATSESNAAGSASSAATQACLLYTSPSPRDATLSRMPSSA